MSDSWDRISLFLYITEGICCQLVFFASLIFPLPRWIGVTLTFLTFATALLISTRWSGDGEE